MDWAFKRIFGSTESLGILLGFLNDLLHDGQPVIVSLTIKDPYLPARLHGLKETAVDVAAKLASGAEVLIEMQLQPVGGFTQRLNYNAAKALTSQLGRGANYRKIRPVTVIAIADCILLPERKPWFSHYTQLERTTHTAYPSGGIDIIFVELPKVNLETLPENHPMRDWLSFLISARSWRSIPKTIQNPQVRQALRLARRDNLTLKESELMSRRQLYHWDQINLRELALEEGEVKGISKGIAQGIAQGIAKGIAQGITKGEEKKRTEMIQSMLAAGIDLAVVSKISGLTQAQVLGLSKTHPGTALKPRRRSTSSKA
jgi:predicted transposase/invertase (TIGR01784 family)